MQNAYERDKLNCPMNGRSCHKGMRDDFENKESCRWWVHLYGKDPQTENTIDYWDCAMAWMPTTSIESAQMSRFVASSVDKLNNTTHETHGVLVPMTDGLKQLAQEFRNLNENIKRLPEPSVDNVIELPSNGNGIEESHE